jgi:hypothetical protein
VLAQLQKPAVRRAAAQIIFKLANKRMSLVFLVS